MRLLIDTNVLMKICHPRTYPEVAAWFADWLRCALTNDEAEIVLTCAADYEIRRGYLYALSKQRDPETDEALGRLDELCEDLGVAPIELATIRRAAQHWADARSGGYATDSDPRSVDWDVIIASQAAEMEAVVVTENTKHLLRYGVQAKNWSDIPAPSH